MSLFATDVRNATATRDDSVSTVSSGSLVSSLKDPTKASALGAGGGLKPRPKELQEARYNVDRSGKRNAIDQQSRKYLDVLLDDALSSQVSLNAALKKIVGAVPASLGHVTHKDGSPKSAKEQLKGTERIEEKKRKYNNDYAGFTDISRASLVFDDPKGLLKSFDTVKSMLSEAGIVPGRVKNRFKEPTDDGYRDILMNVSVPLPGGQHHVAELQFHVKTMIDAKSIAKKGAVSDDQFKELKASASTLLTWQGKDGVSFNEKAVAGLKAIKSAKSADEVTKGGKKGISGHNLYDVKRYLFENQKTIKTAHSDVGAHLNVWTKVAADSIYNPAGKALDDADHTSMEALKALR